MPTPPCEIYTVVKLLPPGFFFLLLQLYCNKVLHESIITIFCASRESGRKELAFMQHLLVFCVVAWRIQRWKSSTAAGEVYGAKKVGGDEGYLRRWNLLDRWGSSMWKGTEARESMTFSLNLKNGKRWRYAKARS